MMRQLALPVLLIAGGAAAIASVGASADPQATREWLRHAQFWILEAQMAAVVVGTVMGLPEAMKLIRPGPGTVAAMLVISAITLLLVTMVAPRTNRIYYDEHIYQSVGQNLGDLHLAQMCNEGNVEYGVLDCARGEYNKEPYGYPYLLSVGFRLFGTSESVAFGLNVLCAVLAVWAVFLTTTVLFDSRAAGVWAAAILMLVPQQLVWCHSAAAEPSAALMSTLALLAGVTYARLRTRRCLAWMVAMVVFASQFRMEAALVAVIVALAVAVMAPEELRRPELWWGAVGGLVLSGAHILHVFSVRTESWGAAGDRLSLSHIVPNLAANGPFYLENVRFPAAFTMLAIVGVLWKPSRRALVPLALFLAFWTVYLLFYAGSYDFGADVRFSLMTYPAIAMLAGRGLLMVVESVPLERRPVAAGATATLALIVQFLWFVPQVRAVGEEAWAARTDVEFARRVIPALPPNSIVLTHNPSIFHLNGMNAAQMSLVTMDPAWVTGHLPRRYAGGVYLHWNAWCGYGDAEQQAFCESTLKAFSSELVVEHRDRDFRYAFYRVRVAGTVPKVAP